MKRAQGRSLILLIFRRFRRLEGFLFAPVTKATVGLPNWSDILNAALQLELARHTGKIRDRQKTGSDLVKFRIVLTFRVFAYTLSPAHT